MKKEQAGFTIIELIIVIMILGILAVIAAPKFLNLSNNAQTAATTGIAAALASANAINYASRSENIANGVSVANCTGVASALQGGVLPTGYTITSTAVTAGNTVTCTVNGPNSSSATFSATGIN